ncbi:MAG: hypothetical protein ACK6D7_22730, partial [Acidobacteriota bacterium]
YNAPPGPLAVTVSTAAGDSTAPVQIVPAAPGIFLRDGRRAIAQNQDFRLTYAVPPPGEYHLFADVAPAGAGGHVLLAKLKVGGRPSAVAPPAPSTVAAFSADPVPAGRTLRLTATLTDPAIEPYLGARGHLILLHEDAETFVHSHPDDSTPSPAREVAFLARFPKPGRYQGWAQFQRRGQVETVPVRFLAQ